MNPSRSFQQDGPAQLLSSCSRISLLICCQSLQGQILSSWIFQMYFIHHFLISLHDCSDIYIQCVLCSMPRAHCNVFYTLRPVKRNMYQECPGGRWGNGRDSPGRKHPENRPGSQGLTGLGMSTLISEGSWSQMSCPGREAAQSKAQGVTSSSCRVPATACSCHRRPGKSCCSGSLHFPNKTALAAKWSWLPGWVQSQPHFSLPISSECNLTSSLLDSFRAL